MSKIFFLSLFILSLGCKSTRQVSSSPEKGGHSRTVEVAFIDDDTYLLTEIAEDRTYGYTEENPVKVGGSAESSGPRNERRFLNALLGPAGESVKYWRVGSCCHFKTPNGLINNTGLLDRYGVTWGGSIDTSFIYINMYDKGNLKIPLGFTARTR